MERKKLEEKKAQENSRTKIEDKTEGGGGGCVASWLVKLGLNHYNLQAENRLWMSDKRLKVIHYHWESVATMAPPTAYFHS